uniref:ComEC/Rec2 family competence protein n=1 Tax=Altererythrobacter segetis TaxID=1104773 RepID=UPI0014085888|nr:ComEC/Rec2 family competence protein [Altererythrobacter segetis]
MATRVTPLVPLGEEPGDAALQQPPWRKAARLSSVADAAEGFLARAGFDRGPWLAVALAGGIAAWFALPSAGWWVATMAAGLIVALGALALWRGQEGRSNLVIACVGTGLLVAFGVALIWARSELVGAEPIERPGSMVVAGQVLERIEQPADDRIRLVLATRERTGRAIKVRVNLPLEQDDSRLREGAVVRLKARLMPPAPPMLPGGYDFARAAWFEGYAATGSVQGPVEILQPAKGAPFLAPLQRRLSEHVRAQLGGSPGAIAAAFASGDRGSISEADEQAMRDAGLTHLLSISGLHVSAVIAGAYFLAITLFALWPWLTLRVRLPLVAAGIGALAGIGYTLLTGAEVPTVRSCVGAVLVLGALALGREPLSLRMLAVGAIFVLLLWPESLAGPSFELSFAAVIAIIALHASRPARAFLAPREEAWLTRLGRHAAMLLLTGLVIEIALMPIVLFHFHRAGIYGAFANVVVIPLVTFGSMPLIALALVLDLVGLGAPVWWLAGKSLELMLWIAHVAAAQPGAVRLMPQMGWGTFALFVAGGLWLALWRGRARLWGFAPAVLATALLLTTPAPDLLIAGDGRNVAIVAPDSRLLLLRDSRSEFTRHNFKELAGVEAEPLALAQWPGAECNADFCSLTLHRAGRDWRLLMSRSRYQVDAAVLAQACARADIVVSDRWLPRTCLPKQLNADGKLLARTGGLSVVLSAPPRVATVASSEGEHGWWRARQ